ncbi:MAG: heavy-metal-associated domain-containing protein [Anaerolineae bacterium]|nr:heavy-metal-associated domain-containing protein [Anaerolineae bacterium]
MSKVTYTVPNISCGHCVHTIKTELSDLPGVASVDAEIESQRVEVTFDEPATEDKIIALMKEINYAPA